MSGAEDTATKPIYGSCERCGCPLGAQAAPSAQGWYCCGPCAGSDRCHCGCGRGPTRQLFSDLYVPLRRMFAARPPDELRRSGSGRGERARAFPFSDPQRGR